MMEKIIQQIDMLASENLEMKIQQATGLQQIEMLASENREMKMLQEDGIKMLASEIREMKAELQAANYRKQSKK